MMRPKSTGRDLPPRMLRRRKRLVSGRIWEAYYYNGRDESGRRVEIPLGTDIHEAKRKWAELEGKKPQTDYSGLMRPIFDRYEREIFPNKAPKTQAENRLEIKRLRAVFDSAPIEAITPQHIAQYRDARMTKARTLKDGTVIPAKRATVAANREISLLSHVINLAREWGYTTKENPCRGVRKNRETPRRFYADEEVWSAVQACAGQDLRDALDLAYLSGQRPGDVLRFTVLDLAEDALLVRQGKTEKYLRILLTDADTGQRTELGQVIDRIRARSVRSAWLLATPDGRRVTEGMLRLRFVTARSEAIEKARSSGNHDLATRLEKFQFRDSRSKAASEMDLEHARKLLGHTDQQITATVYRRVGEKVKPTK